MERSTTLHVSNETGSHRVSRGAERLRLFSRIALGIIALFLPLLFLPGIIDGLEIPKQTFLAFFGSFAALAWLGAMLSERTVSIRASWIHLFSIAFLLAAVISATFSLSPVQSWLGGSDLTLSFLTCASAFAIFYAAMHVLGTTRVQIRFVLLLLLGALVSAGVTLAAMYGFIPFLSAGFSSVGSIVSLTVFLLTVMFLGLALWITDITEEGKPLLRGVTGGVFVLLLTLLGCVTLTFLLAIDLAVLWILTLLTAACVLIFAAFSSRVAARPFRFIPAFLFCVLAALFLAFPSPIHFSKVPTFASPSYMTSFLITRASLLEEGPVHLLFGTGAGTFSIAYLLHRPEGVNTTPFWNTVFEQPSSQLFSLFHGFGLVGGSLLVAFFLLLFVRAVAVLVTEQDKEEWSMTFALTIGWVALLFAHLLLPSTLTLTGILALLSGLLASQVCTHVYKADFSRAPRAALLASFGFVLLAVLCVSGAAYAGARLGGDVLFSEAIRADRDGASLEEVVAKLEEAVALDPLNIPLLKNLATARLRLVSEKIRAAGSSPSPETIQSIQSIADVTVRTAERATVLAPRDASVWSLRARIYRELMPYTPGAEDYAATAYARALLLDPTNPALHVDAGRVPLLVAMRARAAMASKEPEVVTQATEAEKTNLALAESAFQKAIALKSDYAQAHYFLAVVYGRQNRLDEAVARLNLVLTGRPQDVGLLLERALLDIQRERFQEARTTLETITKISPAYSNAWWYLSSVAEKLGDISSAKTAAEKVLELNPGNANAEARVQYFSQPTEEAENLPEPLSEEDIQKTSR